MLVCHELWETPGSEHTDNMRAATVNTPKAFLHPSGHGCSVLSTARILTLSPNSFSRCSSRTHWGGTTSATHNIIQIHVINIYVCPYRISRPDGVQSTQDKPFTPEVSSEASAGPEKSSSLPRFSFTTATSGTSRSCRLQRGQLSSLLLREDWEICVAHGLKETAKHTCLLCCSSFYDTP